MSATAWFSYFVGIWASVYLADAALRTHPYTRQWYQTFTTRMGVSVDVLQARFFTDRFNGLFQFIGRFDLVPWKIWFSCGVLFSATFMIFSIFLLALLVYNTLMQKTIKGGTLTPVMPGVNLPINHLGFYLLTLLLCAFLHEAGHALAALRERVRLHGFGLFLFGFYPGAFVDLNTADLQSLKPLGQLRVYCAGVWHNAVIAVLSMLFFYAMPTLLYPAYHTGNAVGITYLRENSVVTGYRGLSVGDAITHVNSCPVTNESEWYRCLEQAHKTPTGYCLSGLDVNNMDSSIGTVKSRSIARRNLAAIVPKSNLSVSVPISPIDDCCANQSSSTHLCFTYIVTYKNGFRSTKYACLPARPVTERASCLSSSDCISPAFVRHADADSSAGEESASTPAHNLHSSSRSVLCVIPSPPDNHTRLVRLAHNRKDAPALLFLGPMEDLLASVGVSDYVSRWPAVLSPQLPMVLGLFCTYLFSLSGALVIFNVVPCYALDGQWILKALIDLCLSGLLPSRRIRHWLFRIILCGGTLLLFTNVFLAFCFFFSDNSTSLLLVSSGDN